MNTARALTTARTILATKTVHDSEEADQVTLDALRVLDVSLDNATTRRAIMGITQLASQGARDADPGQAATLFAAVILRAAKLAAEREVGDAA